MSGIIKKKIQRVKNIKLLMTTTKKGSNEISNFYNLIPEDLKKKYHNPNFLNHLIKIPARLLIIGGSGSGKTNVAMEIIHRMSGTFEKIVICCKSKAEPLYEFLETKISPEHLEIYEGIENVPPVDKYKGTGQMLIIFDDLVLDKNQAEIEQYFIRGRKIGGGITCIYLSQSYFKTPKTIRLQCNYLILKKLSSKRDLAQILNEFSLGKDIKELTALYKDATTNPLSFLMIDADAPEEMKFRKGFLEIY